MINKLHIFLVIVIFTFFGCDEITNLSDETNEFRQLNINQVFSNESTTNSFLNGLYFEFKTSERFSNIDGTANLLGGTLQALTCLNTRFSSSGSSGYREFSNNDISPDNTLLAFVYNKFYKIINGSSFLIARVSSGGVGGLDPQNKEALRMMGEARCLRSYAYLNLAQLFGNVPYLNESNATFNFDEIRNTASAQLTKRQILELSLADVNRAIEQLAVFDRNDTNGNTGISEFQTNFFNLNAARFLKIKITVELAYAIEEESGSIDSELLQEAIKDINDFPNIFSLADGITTANAIVSENDNQPPPIFFQIPFISQSTNNFNILFNSGDNTVVFDNGIRNFLLSRNELSRNGGVGNAHLFTENDGLITKYKNSSQNFKVLRVAELYLLAAECHGKLGQFNEARTRIIQLNSLRSYTGPFPNPEVFDESNYNEEVFNAYLAEFFQENIVYQAMIRLGLSETELSTNKRVPYFPERKNLWPIPALEVNENSAIIQNPGY